MEENDSFSLHFPSPFLSFLTYSGGILPIRRTFRDRPKVAKVPSPQPKKMRWKNCGYLEQKKRQVEEQKHCLPADESLSFGR